MEDRSQDGQSERVLEAGRDDHGPVEGGLQEAPARMGGHLRAGGLEIEAEPHPADMDSARRRL